MKLTEYIDGQNGGRPRLNEGAKFTGVACAKVFRYACDVKQKRIRVDGSSMCQL